MSSFPFQGSGKVVILNTTTWEIESSLHFARDRVVCTGGGGECTCRVLLRVLRLFPPVSLIAEALSFLLLCLKNRPQSALG